jgi:hypothetical protein
MAAEKGIGESSAREAYAAEATRVNPRRDSPAVTRFSTPPRVPPLKGATGRSQTVPWHPWGTKAMRSGERVDEKGEKVRRGRESAIDHTAETESLGWALRWLSNLNPRNSLQDPSPEHLFRC